MRKVTLKVPRLKRLEALTIAMDYETYYMKAQDPNEAMILSIRDSDTKYLVHHTIAGSIVVNLKQKTDNPIQN